MSALAVVFMLTGIFFSEKLTILLGADKDVFHMSNGCQIPISRRKSKDVQNAYIKFCFEQMRKEINSATDVAQ